MRGPEPDPFIKLDELARSGGRELVKRTFEDPDASTQEAIQFYDRVVARYSDIPRGSGTLGEAAATALFQIRELAVGKPAPEVEGTDVEGKSFRLRDYRAKVVVLTFSIDQAGPCRDAYPHQRALVERMKGRTFALLSVNIDDNKEQLSKSIASGAVTWRCCWEGGEKRPNCDRWRVGFIPSVYVIDADALIRANDIRGSALDEAVDALMAKLQGPAPADVQ
jgi:hypothetical protein